jgi:hypothetical protein
LNIELETSSTASKALELSSTKLPAAKDFSRVLPQKGQALERETAKAPGYST